MSVRFNTLVAAIAPAFTLCACSPSTELEAVRQQADTLKRQVDSVVVQRDAALKERDELKRQVEELLTTPTVLLARVTEPVEARNLQAAEQALEALTRKFPQSQETKAALQRVDALRAKLARQEEENRRLAALGFKALKVSSQVELGEVKVRIGTPRFNRQFVFDRYDSSYRYRDADRDHKYVLASLSATAAKGVSDPKLPGVALYWADGKVLRKVTDFDMEFARWEDYGTYLGNYHDSGNDFAKTATISFELGAQGSDADLARRPLYLVATKHGCQSQGADRFRNPPVYYYGSCSDLAPTVQLDAFAEDGSLAVVNRID